MKTAVKTVQ